MLSVSWILADLAATAAAGERLGSTLEPGCVVLLEGSLGSGKTTLCKSICSRWGVNPSVVISPTYTLVNMYPSPRGMIYHLDLFRLEDQRELDDFDLEDLVSPDGVTLVEWPKLLRPLLSEEGLLELNLSTIDTGRQLDLRSSDPMFARLAS